MVVNVVYQTTRPQSHASAYRSRRRMSTDRPKRVTRFPRRYLQDDELTVATPKTRGTKRKINHQCNDDESEGPAKPTMADPSLAFLLQDPKSMLTQINISDIINLDTWNKLSHSSQTLLASFLPPTAFLDHASTISPFHPSQEYLPATISFSAHRQPASSHFPEFLLPGFFNDPHFLSAAHTFQDHLFSSFFSPSAAAALKTWHEDVCSGKRHFPWKDELWEQDHREAPGVSKEDGKRAKAGAASELSLSDLAKRGILKVGDLLVYKRYFVQLGETIEKHLHIEVINPHSYALTVLIPSGDMTQLPNFLPSSPVESHSDRNSLRQVIITSPTQLESAILDIDGRIDRGKRPNGNAWKSTVVWRATGALPATDQAEDVQGRECFGTLFYLRGCLYQDG